MIRSARNAKIHRCSYGCCGDPAVPSRIGRIRNRKAKRRAEKRTNKTKETARWKVEL